MTELSHHRFAEYATSGAFSISLTRRQVSNLALLAQLDTTASIPGADPLERKGLMTTLPAADDNTGFGMSHITPAGLLVAQLCALAGLTNAPVATEAQVIEDLHRQLPFGGIVGIAEIVDCVERSSSPWFFGRYGLVLRNARPVEFIPVRGKLSFFDWREQIGATHA